MIDFPVEDQSGAGYLALPQGGSGPGVLVLHAWWGLNATFQAAADRLAAAGFVAFAPDLYNGQIATTIDDAERLMKAMDGDATVAVVSAASAFLRGHPATTGARIGVIGFSLGGSWALMLDEAVGAIVTFYGIGDVDSVTADALIQGHFASDDQFDSAEDARAFAAALNAAGHPTTLYIYPNTQHWFVEPDRPEYDAAATELAWQRTTEFLHEQLAA